jgi:hypothetical protein
MIRPLLGLRRPTLQNLQHLRHHYFLVVLQHTLLLEEYFQNLRFLGVFHLIQILLER